MAGGVASGESRCQNITVDRNTDIYTHTQMCTHPDVYTHRCVHAQMHIQMYTEIHTDVYTHRCTHTQKSERYTHTDAHT